MATIPKYLYKYRSLAGDETKKRTFDILEKEEIYFPKFPELNDPFDGHVVFRKNISVKDVERFANGVNRLYPENPFDYKTFLNKNGKMNRKLVKQFCDALPSSRALFPKYGVLCLSESATNILMWSHYSQYSGIAIEFDTQGSTLEEPNKLLKVQYRKGYAKIKLTDFSPDNDDAVYRVFCQKYLNWKYEKEWRAISHEGGTVQKLPAKISGVVLGPLIDPNDELRIRQIAARKNWTLSKLHESTSSYKLYSKIVYDNHL